MSKKPDKFSVSTMDDLLDLMTNHDVDIDEETYNWIIENLENGLVLDFKIKLGR